MALIAHLLFPLMGSDRHLDADERQGREGGRGGGKEGRRGREGGKEGGREEVKEGGKEEGRKAGPPDQQPTTTAIICLFFYLPSPPSLAPFLPSSLPPSFPPYPLLPCLLEALHPLVLRGGSNKQREPDEAVRTALLETLLLFCSTRSSR